MPRILHIERIENQANKVSEVNEYSTDDQYPSAKAVYNSTSNLGSVVDTIIGIQNTIVSGKVTEEQLEALREQGRREEYNTFWDMFQDSGNRTNYISAFRNWSAEYIHPKYKVVPTHSLSASYIFADNKNLKKVEAAYFDFSQKEKGTTTNQNSGYYYTFYNSNELEEIEDIGLVPQYICNNTFYNCKKLKTIAKLGVDVDTKFNNAFYQCYELENLIIDGEIGQNGFDVKHCTKLSKASIESVINALYNNLEHLSTIGNPTVTLSKTAVENAGFTDFDCLANAEFGSDIEEDGLTITNNGDGSFTLNGTYTQPGALFFEVAKFTLPQGTKVYTLDIGSESSNVIMIRTYGGLMIDGECSKAEYETSNEEIHLELVIPYNIAFDNVRVTPKLVYDEWETLELSKKYWTISRI